MPSRFPRRIHGFVLAIVCSLAACTGPPDDPSLLASYDGGDLRATDLDDFILTQPEAQRRPAEGEDRQVWRRKMLEMLIAERALEAEALSAPPDEATTRVVEARRQAALEEIVRARCVAERGQVRDEDLRTFYDENPDEFGHAEQVRLRHIFKRVSRTATAAERARIRAEADALRKALDEGAVFTELARTQSDSETARFDGLIGRLGRGDLEPAVERIVFGLDEGETSGVVPTAVGFHIFQVVNHVPTFRMPFEEARTRIQRRLTKSFAEKAVASCFEELLEASGATFAPELAEGANADPAAVIFALGEDRITVGDLRDRLEGMSFSAQRERSIREHLTAVATSQLFQWQAARDGLVDEADVATQLAAAERDTRIQRARRVRFEAALDKVPESALRTLYDTNRSRFQTPQLYRLRILTRAFPEDDTKPYRHFEALAALAEQVRSGARAFEDLAREVSDDLTAHAGGDVGRVRLDGLFEWAGPNAQKKVEALLPGDVSEPILIERYDEEFLKFRRQGYMLVQLLEVEPSAPLAFEEVTERLRSGYLQRELPTISSQVRADLLTSVSTRVFEDRL